MTQPTSDFLIEKFKSFNKELITQGHKINELFDSIIVWFIGLSTGTVVLAFSSLDKIKFIGLRTVNIPLAILVGSILLGIIGRVFYALAIHLEFKIMSLLM